MLSIPVIYINRPKCFFLRVISELILCVWLIECVLLVRVVEKVSWLERIVNETILCADENDPLRQVTACILLAILLT